MALTDAEKARLRTAITQEVWGKQTNNAEVWCAAIIAALDEYHRLMMAYSSNTPMNGPSLKPPPSRPQPGVRT